MMPILILAGLLLQTGIDPLLATDIKEAVIQATVEEAIEEGRTDTTIRTVDAGGYNVGVGVVHRAAGGVTGGAIHNLVTEVYHVLAGSGILVTGGQLVNPEVREDDASVVVEINGPGVGGDGIEGGVSRRVDEGDVIIIPAGTAHRWSAVFSPVTYTVVRVDPQQVVTPK
jgi:quercetin dioxygenase-like cupin family protein